MKVKKCLTNKTKYVIIATLMGRVDSIICSPRFFGIEKATAP